MLGDPLVFCMKNLAPRPTGEVAQKEMANDPDHMKVQKVLQGFASLPSVRIAGFK